MRIIHFLFNLPITLAVAWLLAEFMMYEPSASPREREFSGQATWISDGDTLRVVGHRYPVRIWGIDAPERDTAQSQDARAFLTQLIGNQTLFCVRQDVDRFQRTVAQCKANDQDLAAALIANGHAFELCRYSRGYYGNC